MHADAHQCGGRGPTYLRAVGSTNLRTKRMYILRTNRMQILRTNRMQMTDTRRRVEFPCSAMGVAFLAVIAVGHYLLHPI